MSSKSFVSIGKVGCMAALFLLVASGLTFASGSSEKSSGTTGKETTVTIILGNWAPPVLKPFFQKYGEQNHVKIKYEDYPFRDLFNTIQVRHNAHSNNVDAIFVDAPLVPFYATHGYIDSLDKYFSKSLVKATWAPMSGQAAYWDGKFYAPPLNNSTQVLYYNINLLKKAGVTPPSGSTDKRWTWAHLVSAAQKIADKPKGIWGFEFDQINRYYQLEVLPVSLGGGNGLAPGGKAAQLTTKPWIDAFTWYQNLYNKWGVSPKGVSATESPQLFAAGKVGFFVGGLWNIAGFTKSAKKNGFEFGVAPHPYFAAGKPVTPTLSWHVGVWKYTRHENAAAAFVKYLTTNSGIGKYWLENYGQFPARLVALKEIGSSEKYAKQPYIAYRIGTYEVAHTAILRAKTPVYLQFEQVLDKTFEDIRNGANVQQALSSAQQKIDGYLNQYYSQN